MYNLGLLRWPGRAEHVTKEGQGVEKDPQKTAQGPLVLQVNTQGTVQGEIPQGPAQNHCRGLGAGGWVGTLGGTAAGTRGHSNRPKWNGFVQDPGLSFSQGSRKAAP